MKIGCSPWQTLATEIWLVILVSQQIGTLGHFGKMDPSRSTLSDPHGWNLVCSKNVVLMGTNRFCYISTITSQYIGHSHYGPHLQIWWTYNFETDPLITIHSTTFCQHCPSRSIHQNLWELASELILRSLSIFGKWLENLWGGNRDVNR